MQCHNMLFHPELHSRKLKCEPLFQSVSLMNPAIVEYACVVLSAYARCSCIFFLNL